MDNTAGASNNNDSINDDVEDRDHALNYIEAVYKLMSFSLQRNEPSEGHALRREQSISSNSNLISSSELWAQQSGAMRQGSTYSPSVGTTGSKPEKRHPKGSSKKHRKTLIDEEELLDETLVPDEINGNADDNPAFKRRQHRRRGKTEHHKTEQLAKPKPEPEVIFYDSTAEKGTQTKAD